MPAPSCTLENKTLTGEATAAGDGLPVQFSQATAEGEQAISLRPMAPLPAGQISYRTITW
ncbi:MAG: hypothetical protein FJ049_02255 [Cyanobacteria bacterium M_surface_7_m2_037]|nr:hypothetical protein [Cyanobacteria bacterium M_surface_7_m2_037]